MSVQGQFSNPIEALNFIKSNPVQLVFLDINMPDLNGMNLSKLLPTSTRIIFTTAYDHYALESYKVDAIDYLLKPFSFEEFLVAVHKAKDLIEVKSSRPEKQDHIFIKADYKLHKIAFEDILFIENLKDYVRFYIKNDKKLMSLIAMKTLDELLPENFMRVHRSFIINLNCIELVERNRIVIGKEYIPVADNYRDKFKQYLDTKTV